MRDSLSVVVYGKTRQRECAVVAEGFETLGATVSFHGLHGFTESDFDSAADVVVTFGQRLWSGEIARIYREAEVPVLTVDLPAIRRKNYRALWLNHVNWLPVGPLPPHRLYELGIELSVRDPGSGILVCGQKGGDAAHDMSRAEMIAWAETSCAAALEVDHVTWRPHPQEQFKVSGCRYSDPEATTIDDALAHNWRAVVTFNSTCGVEALIRGVPVVCSSKASYADLCSTSLDELESPYRPAPRERAAFLARLSFTQWTFIELATGEPQAFVLDHNQHRRAA
jgi:hypothetical protein